MLSYLKKFESLPIDLRKKVSNKEVIGKISQLENKYELDLVPLIIKIIIKDISWNNLIQYLMEDFSINVISAENLKDDLATQVFYNIADYLGIEVVKKEKKDPEEKVFLPKTNEEKRLPAYEHDNDELDLVKVEKDDKGKEKKELDIFGKEEERELEEIALTMDEKDKDNKDKRDEKFIQILDDIIREIEVSLSSEASQKRFRNIILTYLKGIRTKAKTRYALGKDFDKGGLGLGEKTIDNIIFLSDKYIKLNDTDNKGGEKRKDSIFDFDKEANLGGPDLPSKNYYSKPDEQEELTEPVEEKKSLDLKNMPNRDIDYDLASLKKSFDELSKSKAKKDEEELKNKQEESEYDLEEILKTNLEEKEDSQEIIKKEDKKKEDELIKELRKNKKKEVGKDKSEEKESIISNFSQEEDNIVKQDKKIKREGGSIFGFKKKINDIKKPPKLLNPVSELKYIDLFTFRRLGDNPQKRIEKIKEKISNLEKKFFYRKVQGVQAWRQSPVNRIYLNMGNESIVYSKSIDDIIKGRKKENKDYLEKDEFESIMDLNNDLKYY